MLDHNKYAILNALGQDYMNMCLVDPKKDVGILLKYFNEDMIEDDPSKQLEFSYAHMCKESIARFVSEDKKEDLLKKVDINNVIQNLQDKSEYSIFCDVKIDNKYHNCQLKYVYLRDHTYILMGLRIVDEIMASQNNVNELIKERMFLDVLCEDYTSVYFLDLKKNEAEILKLSNEANANKMLDNKSRSIFNYYERMCMYCKNYVAQSYQEEFLKVMDVKNIKDKLVTRDRFVYRYKSVPNLSRHQYFEIQVVKVKNEGFKDTALLAFRHMDDIITAEQKHQQELAESLEKEKRNNEFLKAISQIYYGIFRIDLVHDTYEQISSTDDINQLAGHYGQASKELIEVCHKYVNEEFQSRMLDFFNLQKLARRLENEDTLAREYLAKDGNWHTARFIVERRNEHNEVTNVLYVTRLISAEKRREHIWISRAEEANLANQAKTNFLRRMSHDIRTPIHGILGMLEMENRNKEDVDKLQECRDKIWDAAQYLLSIVNNVLDISKVEAGNFVLERKSFDLVTLLMQQLSLVKNQAKESGIQFYGGKEMSEIHHRYLVGSPDHLNRVLMNLASNAIKYNRIGGSLTLYCMELSYKDSVVLYEFVCSDTGRGMSKEFQKHAFDAFSQEGKVPLSAYNGSGLGLSIVKDIVEQMNGEIELESEEGKGTTFKIQIPFEVDTTHTSQEEKEEIYESVSGKKALLVEDNALNREIAQMILEDEGLIVSHAENGKEALEIFGKSNIGEYDFIFMDVMMPVMDGIEATKQIRLLEREDAKTISILAMSANAFQDDIQLAMNAGMDAYLTKPLNMKEVKDTIRKMKKIKKM